MIAARHLVGAFANQSMQHPEPHAFEDPLRHPLWATLCGGCVNLPNHIQDAYVLSGHPVQCSHSCMIVVSTKGRLLYQCRREGKQLFGGGKHVMPLVWRFHAIRREQWMESNLDVASNPAVVSLSNPILVMQEGCERGGWGGCLVQICIIDDDHIRIMDDGRVIIGYCAMWSREVARDRWQWPELAPAGPSPEHLAKSKSERQRRSVMQNVQPACSLSRRL